MVSTKTLLLKHCYRRQGKRETKTRWRPRFSTLASRNAAILKTQKRCDFYSAPLKNLKTLAIFPRLLRLFGTLSSQPRPRPRLNSQQGRRPLREFPAIATHYKQELLKHLGAETCEFLRRRGQEKEKLRGRGGGATGIAAHRLSIPLGTRGLHFIILFSGNYFRGVPSDGLRRYGLSILDDIREIRGLNAVKTRLKCTHHEICPFSNKTNLHLELPGIFRNYFILVYIKKIWPNYFS